MAALRRNTSHSSLNQASEETSIYEQEFSWDVEVPHKDLGTSSEIAGFYQVKLSKSGFALQRLQDPYNTMILPLCCIRSCGCLRERFYLELGRSAITGEGKLWMLLQNTTSAKTMKKTCSRFFGKKNGNGGSTRYRRRAQSLSLSRVTFSDNDPNSSEHNRNENSQSSQNRSSNFVRDLYASFRRCVTQKQEDEDFQDQHFIASENRTPNASYTFKRSMSVPAANIHTVPRVPAISVTGPPTDSRGPPLHNEFKSLSPKLEILKTTIASEEVKNYNYRGYNESIVMNSYYTKIEESPFERENQDQGATLPRMPSVVENLCRKAERFLPAEQYLQMTPTQESNKIANKAGTINTNNSYLSMNVGQASSAPEEYLLFSPSGNTT